MSNALRSMSKQDRIQAVERRLKGRTAGLGFLAAVDYAVKAKAMTSGEGFTLIIDAQRKSRKQRA